MTTTLIERVREIRQAVTGKLPPDRKQELADTFTELRDKLIKGKEILFDSGTYNVPEEKLSAEERKDFDKWSAQWKAWAEEYERIIALLIKYRMLPPAVVCKVCTDPVYVPWNDRCEKCMDKEREG